MSVFNSNEYSIDAGFTVKCALNAVSFHAINLHSYYLTSVCEKLKDGTKTCSTHIPLTPLVLWSYDQNM